MNSWRGGKNMLDWMRKAKGGRAGVGLKIFHICRTFWRVREGSAAWWLEANGRKQNIWCSCDLGPARLGILMMQLAICFTHTYNIISYPYFTHKKLRSYFSPTHLMGDTLLAGLVLVFIQSSSSWVFQPFLLNLAEESQVNDCGRECGLFSVKYDYRFYLMLPHRFAQKQVCFTASSPLLTPLQPVALKLPYRFVFLASCSCLMSFRRLQFLFCPQEYSSDCFKLITMRFCCPIDSHLNHVTCGHCLQIQAMEMTSLSADSLWWRMAHIRKQSEPKETSVINHRNYNVLVFYVNPTHSAAGFGWRSWGRRNPVEQEH